MQVMIKGLMMRRQKRCWIVGTSKFLRFRKRERLVKHFRRTISFAHFWPTPNSRNSLPSGNLGCVTQERRMGGAAWVGEFRMIDVSSG